MSRVCLELPERARLAPKRDSLTLKTPNIETVHVNAHATDPTMP